VHTRFDTTDVVGNTNQLTLTPAFGIWDLKALSGDFGSAAIVSKASELSLFKFAGTTAVVSTTPEVKMVATAIVTTATVSAATTPDTITVADNCDAVKIGAYIYFMNAGRTNMIIGAALPAMTNPVYSSDFQIIVVDDGIFTLVQLLLLKLIVKS